MPTPRPKTLSREMSHAVRLSSVLLNQLTSKADGLIMIGSPIRSTPGASDLGLLPPVPHGCGRIKKIPEQHQSLVRKNRVGAE